VSEADVPVRPGDLVGGKYRVERTLGAGGMGVVVAARQIDLDRPVALKFLQTKLLETPGLVTRFSREARAAAKLESEHVARVLDVGTLPTGEPYMVMEYLEGEDLAQRLASRGPVPFTVAVGYVLQACEAVAEAHALGIIHRDLKPGNLFLANRASGPPVIKVLDFGLSKSDSPGQENVTSESSILGSPLYMSPEQLMSARTADARSDIWSLGIVLYELLTGHTPFPYERIAGLVAAILQKAPQPIDTWRADVPPGLQGVVIACLEKEPAKRLSSVAGLAVALGPFGPPGSDRSIQRILHVLREADPSVAAPRAATLAPTEPDRSPPAGPAVASESVAGSSRTIRERSPATTLASGPDGARTQTRRVVRRWVVVGLTMAGLAASAGFALIPGRAGNEKEVSAARPVLPRTGISDATTLVPPAPAQPLESAAPVLPAASSLAPQARALPAEPRTKRLQPAAPASAAVAPSPPPAPAPSSSPEDPLRRLQTM
jgi:serine/threonine protein kinase